MILYMKKMNLEYKTHVHLTEYPLAFYRQHSFSVYDALNEFTLSAGMITKVIKVEEQ